MGISVFPAPSAASKTRYVVTLTSGTSWTVPTGVTYVNATLIGGGGGGSSQGNSNGNDPATANPATGGQIIETNVNTTPGNSIIYGIGAGGGAGSNGGSTTFTGATTASGGIGGGSGAFNGATGTSFRSASNGGNSAFTWGSNDRSGGTGGSGCIILEYWA